MIGGVPSPRAAEFVRPAKHLYFGNVRGGQFGDQKALYVDVSYGWQHRGHLLRSHHRRRSLRAVWFTVMVMLTSFTYLWLRLS